MAQDLADKAGLLRALCGGAAACPDPLGPLLWAGGQAPPPRSAAVPARCDPKKSVLVALETGSRNLRSLKMPC